MLIASILVATLLTLAPEPTRVRVEVDPRVELLTVIFRLSGAEEFNSARTRSPYTDDVDKWFAKFRDHAAVAAARKLREEHGISYDTVATFALHVTDAAAVEERVPFDPIPERLADRWTTAMARGFLPSVRAFAKDTDFAGFLAAHRELYAKVAARMDDLLQHDLKVEWFNAFFGGREIGEFIVSPGLVAGPHNFGVGVRFGAGKPEEIHPVIGAWKFDDDGVPVFDHSILPVIVHEFCHSWANPLVDAHAEALEASGKKLFPPIRATMQRQAYTTWRTVLHESLTRASVLRYLAKNGNADDMRAGVEFDRGQGFTWTTELADVLAKYEADRKLWPELDAFMPEVVAYFDARAAAAPDVEVNAPRVVRMTPANGAVDVDPKTTAFSVEFDRPMNTRGWSVVGGGPDFPKTTSTPSWDKTGKVFSMPVQLEPGHRYRFGLNGVKYTAFQSRDGVPLVPVEVTFATRSE